MERNDIAADVIAARIRSALDALELAKAELESAAQHLCSIQGPNAAVCHLTAANMAVAIGGLLSTVHELPIDELALDHEPSAVERARYAIKVVSPRAAARMALSLGGAL